MEKLTKHWLQSSTDNAERMAKQEKEAKAKQDFENLVNECNRRLRESASHGYYSLSYSVTLSERIDLKQLADHFGDLWQEPEIEGRAATLKFSWEARSQ